MNMQSHPHEKSGVLRIRGGIRSPENALAIKAALEDLPGVYGARMTPDAVFFPFNPDLTTEQQLFEAVKLGGFRASDFFVAEN